MLYRREFDRSQLREFLRVYDLESMSILGYVFDISLDGMQLVGREPFEIDQLYRFYIELPSEWVGADGHIEATANIIWRKQDRLLDYHDAGFQFIGIDWDDKQQIDFLIDNFAADDQYQYMH